MVGGGSRGTQRSIPVPRGDTNRARLIARALALIAELSTCVEALDAPRLEPVGVAMVEPELGPWTALSTRVAAHRLGISTYTLNELARRGVIPSRQDAPRGPRHFRSTDLDAYETERTGGRLANGPDQRYETVHDEQRRLDTPAPPRHDAAPARGGARRDGAGGGALGARPARRRPAGDARPYAPGAAAWHRPKEPED